MGEFNNWSPEPQHWAIKNPFGVWELFLPDLPDGSSAIPHRSKVKARLETAYGEWVERIPAWIKWATQVRLPRRVWERRSLHGLTLPGCGRKLAGS